MIKSQRILVGISLPLLAWVLHVGMCDWAWRQPITRTTSAQPDQAPLLAVRGRDPQQQQRVVLLYTGILTQPGIEVLPAMIWGIALPLALIAADMYLILGWRHQSRLAHGLCANCGYDLRGRERGEGSAPPLGGPCPECGFKPTTNHPV